jgi:tetratricopeptide (TPR) repeat protein/transcriptional regulator with XRE-family HTH domain
MRKGQKAPDEFGESALCHACGMEGTNRMGTPPDCSWEDTDDLAACAFPALLRRHRVAARLTQEQLADRSGLSVRSVSQLERGRVRHPRPESVRRLAAALGLAGTESAHFADVARARYWTERSRGPDAAGPVPASTRSPGERPRTGAASRPVPMQLPRDALAFTGRTTELSTLDALLAAATAPAPAVSGTAAASPEPAVAVISAVSGAPGVGKTALAVHWAHRVAHHFPDGQLYVNLRGFDPGGRVLAPSEAVRGFLAALGVPPERIPPDLDTQAALYRSLLAGRRVLVLLDNARDAEQARPLLPGTPTALTVVTSRNRLTGLVATDGGQPLILDVLSGAEARQLLGRRLGIRRVSAEPEATERIIARCAGLPLALTITAARAATNPRFPLVALAAELADTSRRLDALTAGDPASDVRAVFSWSYTALTPQAARLFRLLGLHPGPDFSAAAAASLAAVPPDRAASLLAELTRASLVIEHQPGRFTFHDLLRAYAGDLARAVDRDEQAAALRRLLDYYVHSTCAADRCIHPARDTTGTVLPATSAGVTAERFANAGQAMAWLTAEHPVLLAAITRASESGLDAHAWHLAWGLHTFLHWRGRLHDLEAAWAAALEAGRRLADTTVQAVAYRMLAVVPVMLGRHEEAAQTLETALSLFERAGNLVGQGYTHANFAILRERQARSAEVMHHGVQALALFRAAGDLRGQAVGLNIIGWSHTVLGNHSQALASCREALALFETVGDPYGQSDTLDSLGHAYHHMGRFRDAADCYRQTVALRRQLGDQPSEARTLIRLGDTYQDAGDRSKASASWQQALDLLNGMHHPDADHVRARLDTHQREGVRTALHCTA